MAIATLAIAIVSLGGTISLCTVLPPVVNSDCTVTVLSPCSVSDWWNRSFAVYVLETKCLRLTLLNLSHFENGWDIDAILS